MLEGGSGNERIGQRDRDRPSQPPGSLGDLAGDVDLAMRREERLHGDLIALPAGEQLSSCDDGVRGDPRRWDPSGSSDVVDEDVGVLQQVSHGAPARCGSRDAPSRSVTEW